MSARQHKTVVVEQVRSGSLAAFSLWKSALKSRRFLSPTTTSMRGRCTGCICSPWAVTVSIRRWTEQAQSNRRMTVHPDLIVLDLAMPHVDGWAAAERLRRSPCHARDSDHRADCAFPARARARACPAATRSCRSRVCRSCSGARSVCCSGSTTGVAVPIDESAKVVRQYDTSDDDLSVRSRLAGTRPCISSAARVSSIPQRASVPGEAAPRRAAQHRAARGARASRSPRSFTVDPDPRRRARNIFPRFDDNARVLRAAYRTLADDVRPRRVRHRRGGVAARQLPPRRRPRSATSASTCRAATTASCRRWRRASRPGHDARLRDGRRADPPQRQPARPRSSSSRSSTATSASRR